jgi:hypothetical protein
MGARDPGRSADQQALRVSDAERDNVLGELRDSFADGRLTQDTFVHRVEAVLRARVRGELGALLADLPRARRLGGMSSDRLATSVHHAIAATHRWLRKAPATLTLPAGTQRRFTIGRELACDMTLADKTVSRWHASLQREADGWLLSDLGSTNGTRLNGWRVSGPILVGPGDMVSFGAATFVLAERPVAAAATWR